MSSGIVDLCCAAKNGASLSGWRQAFAVLIGRVAAMVAGGDISDWRRHQHRGSVGASRLGVCLARWAQAATSILARRQALACGGGRMVRAAACASCLRRRHGSGARRDRTRQRHRGVTRCAATRVRRARSRAARILRRAAAQSYRTIWAARSRSRQHRDRWRSGGDVAL